MRTPLKNIICTTDFSDYSNHAIPYGIALAKEFDAKLYVCHVITLSSALVYGESTSDFEDVPERMTTYAHEQIKQLLGEQPVDWKPLITIGHVADEIAHLAKEKGADMVISATHGRSGLKRLILGSVTERLMHTLPCPFLIVRSPERAFVAPASQEIKLRQILVGCDFSADSLLAFQYGLNLAQEFQSDLHLVHVIEPPVYEDLLRPGVEAAEKSQQTLRDRLNQDLKDMIPEEAWNWCSPKATLLVGHPHEELTKYALINGIDLIVLGVRGLRLVERLFVGSTTGRVVRRAPCSVLSVCAKPQ
ncbi:MAG: universal stress protein [Deltaproteobacteria bacterium]|nr:MAG: universal stress protein [Deltaproteobacteria bacterium]